MTGEPLVTAVVTTRSRPQHVYEALASICAETYHDVECLVVDDGGTFDLSSVRSSRSVRDDDDVALPNRISILLDAATRHGADLCFGMTRRVAVGSTVQLPDVPTHVMSFGAVGLCDLVTCNPHINSVLVRTAALRAAGGFDYEAAHFDDWSAWLRLADQRVGMCCVPDVVAEWRIHGTGLSSEVIHLRAMKARLLALFDRLETQLTKQGAAAIAMARQVVAGTEVHTYDDYVAAVDGARQTLHAGGRCLGPRLQSHGVPRSNEAWNRSSITFRSPSKT